MKKFLSVMLAAIMLAAMFTFSVSASWSEAGYTVVIGDSVHFRYGPGTDYDIVQTVAPATYGDRLGTIMSDKVSRDSSGREWFSTPYGWICMDYVTTYLLLRPDVTFAASGRNKCYIGTHFLLHRDVANPSKTPIFC